VLTGRTDLGLAEKSVTNYFQQRFHIKPTVTQSITKLAYSLQLPHDILLRQQFWFDMNTYIIHNRVTNILLKLYPQLERKDIQVGGRRIIPDHVESGKYAV